MRPPLYYGDYLQLKQLLNCQSLKSDEAGRHAHDEMLFIILHQAYELWFKQILFEVESVHRLFDRSFVPEKDVSLAFSRLQRVIEIQKVLIAQLGIIETMTPADFMEFRDLLTPASGFQSLQFKKLEVLLGLDYSRRVIPFLENAPSGEDAKKKFFMGRLSAEDQRSLMELEKQPTLFALVEKWLERMPFLCFEGFDFWSEYEKSVQKMLRNDLAVLEKNQHLNELERRMQLERHRLNELTFTGLLDPEKYDELRKKGQRRFSRDAMLSALFIFLYRDEPILNLPFRFLNSLIEIDENFTTWRYRHALMVHRILGSKIGTGGSSGHDYLKASTENSKIFTDLFDLPTYLLPRSIAPQLPPNVQQKLGFSSHV